MIMMFLSNLDISMFFAAKYIHRSDPNGKPILVESTNDTSRLTANDTTRLWTPTRNTFRFFFHKNAKYVWNSHEENYARLHGYDKVRYSLMLALESRCLPVVMGVFALRTCLIVKE